MNFASNLLGKAIIKSKTSSIEKSLSSATEVEEHQGSRPELSRRKALSKDEKTSMLSLTHSEHGVGFSVMLKERRWISYAVRKTR